MCKLLLELLVRPTLYSFRRIGWTQRRRARPKDVHVILADVSFLDPYVETQWRPNGSVPVLSGRPLPSERETGTLSPKMILDLVDRM